MGLDPKQLRELVVRPALEEIGLHSVAAEELVLGTAAQESKLKYLHQVKGPALGLFQMEPATYRDIWKNWLPGHLDIEYKLSDMLGTARGVTPDPATMVYNLKFAAAMCRVFYRRVRAPLPLAGDVLGMAEYWKQYYNTHLGKGRPGQFVQAYKTYIA